MILHHLNAVRAALLTLPILILAATSVSQRSAQEIVDQLQLVPNDEKGYYIQTFQDPATVANRSVSTAIYYMLEGSAGRSIWHRLDATEVWHFYAGAPLTLSLSHDDGAPVIKHTLGPDIFSGQSPQVVIPTGTWQSAHSLGRWTLVGTTVTPGFTVSGVELADPGWEPAGACNSTTAR